MTVVLMCQAVFILLSHRHDYFFLDDFLGFIVARSDGLSVSYLIHDVFGQFAPGFRLWNYLYINLIGLHYIGVRLFDIAIFAMESVLLVVLARVWRAPLPVAALVLAFVPFSPIFAVILQWFSSALTVLDGTLLGLAAIICYAQPCAIGWRRRAAGSALFGLSLMFYAKLLFLTILMTGLRFFVASLCGQNTRAALRSTFRDVLPLVPIAIIYILIVALGHYSSGRQPETLASVFAFIRIGFTDGFAANLFGLDPALPWRRGLACGLLLLPIIITAARNPRGLWVWLAFALQFTFGMCAVAWTRVALFGADSAALSRYHPDTAIFYLACCLITLSRAAGRNEDRLRAKALVPGIAACLPAISLAMVFTVASLRTPLLYPFDDGRVRTYVTNFRRSIEASTCREIEDGIVPDWMMPGWMQPNNRYHVFAMLFPASACFIDGARGGVEIDDSGKLKPPSG